MAWRCLFAALVVLALPTMVLTLSALEEMAPEAPAFEASGTCADLVVILLEPAENVTAVGLAGDFECRIPALSALPCPFDWPPALQLANGLACPRLEPPDAWSPASAVLARETAARMRFTVPATLLVGLAVPFFATAIGGIATLLGWRIAAAAGGIAIGAGAVALTYRSEFTLRLYTDLTLLRVAADPAYPFIDMATWRSAYRLIDVSFACIMAACAAAVALLALIAVRAQKSDPIAARTAIIERAFWLRLVLVGVSATLALGVATVDGLMHWPVSLMIPQYAGPMARLAGSASLQYGLVYSSALLLFALPSVAALRFDIKQLETSPGEEPLMKRAGLDVNLRHALASLATLAAPALTGPGLELVRVLIET